MRFKRQRYHACKQNPANCQQVQTGQAVDGGRSSLRHAEVARPSIDPATRD